MLSFIVIIIENVFTPKHFEYCRTNKGLENIKINVKNGKTSVRLPLIKRAEMNSQNNLEISE